MTETNIKSVKSKEDIQDKINDLEGYLKHGYLIIPPPRGENKHHMEGWVKALKWVLKQDD